MNDNKTGGTMECLRFLLSCLEEHYLLYFAGAILYSSRSLLETVLSGQLYRLITLLQDRQGLQEALLGLGMLFIALILVAVITGIGESMYMSSAAEADKGLRMRLSNKISRMPLKKWSKHHSGYWLNLLSRDTDTATSGYKALLINILSMGLAAVGGLLLVLYYDWRLAVFALASGILYFWVGHLFKARAKEAQRIQQEEISRATSVISDILSGFSVIRFYQMTDLFKGKHQESIDKYDKAGRDYVKISAIADTSKSFGYGFAYVGSLVFGLILVNSGTLTISNMLFLWPICMQISYGIQKLGFLMMEMQTVVVACERVETALYIEEERGGSVTKGPDPDVAVSFQDVYFSYDETPVLRGVDLTIPRGQKVVIVGLSGSGKSTLVKLIMNFYQPQRGKVLVAGADTRDYDLDCLRGQFSYLPQNPHLFSGSIRDNILIVSEVATEDQMKEAARKAHAAEFIEEMEADYASNVGEGGGKVSGGQRQRIGLARCYLRDAPIFIMDEMTSALDANLEFEMVRELFDMEDRTLLYITHRLAAAKEAERVIVMENGRIIQDGTHEELLNEEGLYSKLWEVQSSGDYGGESHILLA